MTATDLTPAHLTDLFNTTATRSAVGCNPKNQDGRILGSSNALSDMMKAELLSLLDHCAAAYGTQARFHQAKGCTNLMIACAPQAPSGYKTLARLYMMQGKAAAAVDILDMALNMIPSSAKEYPDIVAEREKASQRMNLCVDFVNTLPFEIVLIVLEHLSFDDRVSCTTVSKSWRERLFSQRAAVIWSDLYLTASFNEWSILSHTLKHARSLHLKNMIDSQTYKLFRCCSLLTTFKHLESLTMDSHTSIDFRTVLEGFGNMKYLKELTIKLQHTIFSFVDILSICPKLKSMTCYHYGTNPCPTATGEMALPDALELESLTIMGEIREEGHIQPVLKRLPLLRNLYLESIPGFSLLGEISTSCPVIDVVVVNDHRREYLPEYFFTHAPWTTNGLITLVVGEIAHLVLESHLVIPLIEKNKDSLKTLILSPVSIDTEHFDENIPLALGDIWASCLTRLEIRQFPREAKENVCSLLRQCPLLSRILIDCSDILDSPEIFESLIDLQHLKDVHFLDGSFDTEAFGRYIDHHIQLGERSKLSELTLDRSLGVNDEILARIPSLKNLTSLNLIDCEDVTASGLANFVGLLKTANMTNLQLGALDGLERRIIKQIGDIRSLQQLTLGSTWTNTTNIDNNCLLDLLERTSTLKTLRVISCPLVTRDIWPNLFISTEVVFR